MNKLEQAARQALEALESAPVQYDFNSYPMLVMTPDTLQTTLTALRDALAVSEQRTEEQAEQEPVAWRAKRPDDSWGYGDAPVPVLPFDTPQKLYAAPVRTKDLTDEEIEKAIVHRTVNWLTNARAVIAADREKNK